MTAPAGGVKPEIRRFVLELAAGHELSSIEDSDSLIENGLIDSLGVFQLVAFLEETFGLRIGDEEILLQNFRTIDAIEAFVVKKRGDRA